MRILLAGINAKYIHTNLAIRSLRQYAQADGAANIMMAEFTINQSLEQILSELVSAQPDVLGVSCYIWNYEMVRKLVPEFKKILPATLVCLGGPEVSYHPAEVLQQTHADVVVIGEGEQTFCRLLRAYQLQYSLQTVDGICYRTSTGIRATPPAAPLDLAQLPFVYEQEDRLPAHQILYFESMRGCPFRCTYCLSGNTKEQVRFLPLEHVCRAMQFFLDHRVRQVKLVDRTFNCIKSYAMAVWRYLAAHDNGYTNFHFEIAGELLDDQMLAFLQDLRAGMVQLEIGVQSTNPETLAAIRRNYRADKLRSVVDRLLEGNNIHLHLDLIAGLPLESYAQFAQSFEAVFALAPHQLQIGFLKLLRGSAVREQQDLYGIVCADYAPYEVLYTAAISYQELQRLKIIAQMVELFHNSNRFIHLETYLQSLFSTAFAFYESLAGFYRAHGYHLRPHTKMGYYTILHEFFIWVDQGDLQTFRQMATLDLYSHEKLPTPPEWLAKSNDESDRERIYQFYQIEHNLDTYLPQYRGLTTKQIYRQAHIEIFSVNPWTGISGITAVLFNYKQRDLVGNATMHVVTLP